ncbi:MAG: ribonuclease P protein component [Candidatus Omnitrophica bacterium]|nr:ribonuclease P protein component [Candidatus Omnitrophota bacterium]
MSGRTFRRPERVRKSREFQAARASGASFKEGPFVLTKLENNTGRHRLGVVVSSYTMPLAHKRNRAKRLVREFFRQNKKDMAAAAHDLIIIVRRPLPDNVEYKSVDEKLRRLMKRAKIL